MTLALEFYQLKQLQTLIKDNIREGGLQTMPEFLCLLVSELGPACHWWAHDPANNPNARQSDYSRADLVGTYGDALMMLFSMMTQHGIDIGEAVRVGAARLQNREWRTRRYLRGDARAQEESTGSEISKEK